MAYWAGARVGVKNPYGKDSLMMLLDLRAVEEMQTIGMWGENKLLLHYYFSLFFEDTFTTKRETGIHRHILSITFDHERVTNKGQHVNAIPVTAILDLSIEAYERMRKHNPSKRGIDSKMPELQTLVVTL